MDFKYLEQAKRLIDTNDIDILISAARKLERLEADEHIGSPMRTGFVDFLAQTKVFHPTKGMVPFLLHPFQTEIAQAVDNQRVAFVVTSRQMGLTSLLCAYVGFAALSRPSRIAVIAPQFKWASELNHRVGAMIEHISVPTKGSTKTKLVFDNDSTVTFISASSTQMPLLDQFDHILVDNADFMPFSKVEEWYATLRAFETGKIVVCSTQSPQRRGLFHRLWVSDISGVRMALPWWKHPDRDETWAQAFRDQLGPEEFREAMCCVFPKDVAKT